MNATIYHRSRRAFTLIEMLTVITVILILAAILLNVGGYVQNKAARSRAESEIRTLAAACENYKADNGSYPMVSIAAGSKEADKSGKATPTSREIGSARYQA